jgi:hypothetical protein
VNLNRVIESLEQAREQLKNPVGSFADLPLQERNQRQHLLEHLNRAWRGDWVRRQARVPLSGKVELTVGVKNVAERLMHKDEYVFSPNAVLVNHTSTGYAFRISSDYPIHLSVGELAYVCFEKDEPLLGTVRWMRSGIVGDTVEFGVHLAYGRPMPIKLRPAFDHRFGAAAGAQAVHFQWGIQLSSDEDEPNTTRFLLSSGLCQTGQLLLAQSESTLTLWQCAECMEQTASLSLFRFISAKPKEQS